MQVVIIGETILHPFGDITCRVVNAKAIGALQGEFDSIQRDINRLITEMNQAIAQSEQFVATLKQ